jgi:hypothetical protein
MDEGAAGAFVWGVNGGLFTRLFLCEILNWRTSGRKTGALPVRNTELAYFRQEDGGSSCAKLGRSSLTNQNLHDSAVDIETAGAADFEKPALFGHVPFSNPLPILYPN